MNDLTTTDPNHPANLPAEATQHAVAVNPFQRMQQSSSMNVGAVAIEQERAIAEAQGQLILAKRFPRSNAAATAEMMDACKSPEFAAAAFYAVPNRGSGPSIRFAEEVARCYGNFQYGHRELSRSDGKSEVEVYAWDMERNNRSTRQITVMHVLDTKSGSRKLTDQADIDNKIANVASKQIRGRILALMPKGLVAAAMAMAKLTLAGGNDKPIAQRVNDMTGAFSKFGVTVAHLEANLGHKLDTTTVDELADLVGIFNAIKEGAKASEYFTLEAKTESTGAAITAVAKQAAAAQPPAEAAPKPAPKAAQNKSKPAESESKPVKEQVPTSEAQQTQPPAAEPPAGADDEEVF